MARLNDLPTTAESIESLKRRFVRQNREIARANSIQSLRIRSLESEVSRLLAENVSLREEVVSLNTEIEKIQSGRQLDNEINTIKGKLDAKLAELGGLITDLGMLPRSVGPSIESRKQMDNDDAQGHRLTVKPVRDNTVADEQRLPIILEDKSYPRLTLDAQDVTDIPEDIDSGESTPDISPAPEIQPTIVDCTTPSREDDSFEFCQSTYNHPEGDSHLLANLETRRKRRDSSLLKDLDLEHAPSMKQQAQSQGCIPKSGSKRKLGAREDENLNSNHAKEFDDFQYTRVGEMSHESQGDNQPRHTNKTTQKPIAQPRRESATGRRVLGPKSTNSNLKSPTKTHARRNAQELSKLETSPGKNKVNKVVPTSAPVTRDQKHIDVAEIRLLETSYNMEKKESISESPDDCEPDISPPADEIEEHRNEPKDTHPPSASTSSTRPSRRSRGAVSYAEPNLRDKMRRPTKELVDAVEAGHFRRMSKPYLEQETACDVKQDAKGDGPAAKARDGEVVSPLQGKPEGCLARLPSNVMTDRKRRTLSASKIDLPVTDDPGPSMSSRAISTLVAGTKPHPQSNQRRNKHSDKMYENSAADASFDSTLLDEVESTDFGLSKDNIGLAGGSRSNGSKSRRTRSSGPVNIVSKSETNTWESHPKVPTKQRVAGSSYAENDESSMSGLDQDLGSRSQYGVGEVKRVERLAARRRSMML